MKWWKTLPGMVICAVLGLIGFVGLVALVGSSISLFYFLK